MILFCFTEPILPDMVATIDQDSIPPFLAVDTGQNKSDTPDLGFVKNYATFSAVGVLVAAKPVVEVISSPFVGFIIERLENFEIQCLLGFLFLRRFVPFSMCARFTRCEALRFFIFIVLSLWMCRRLNPSTTFRLRAWRSKEH